MPTVAPTIAMWQSERHEIGMLEFLPSDSSPERFPYWPLPSDVTFLGNVECDALCLMDDGTLCLFDHEVAERTLCKAAPNQSNLIDSLLAVEDHLNRCGEDDALADDESAEIAMREHCTATIGGPNFASFIQLFFWA